MVPLLVLLAASFAPSEAFKVHGEESHVAKISVQDMEGATSVAQVAYQQQLISANTWKAFSNASSFLEAAHSAGLDWTHSDARNHLVLTAVGLKKSMESGELHARRPSLRSSLGSKANFDGLGKMMEDEDVQDFGGEVFGATLGLLVGWAQSGKPPSVEDIAKVGFDMATMAIGMFNPLLGAVAGMAFSIISSILFPEDENESPMAKMYKKIMEEVGSAITKQAMKTEVGNAQGELGAVMDELQWMPGLLGGGTGQVKKPSDDQARVLLTYNIMIQHDIAKIAFKIQNSAFGKAESSGEATGHWAAAMFPIARELLTLQTNLLYDIGAHEIINNTNGSAVRTLDLLTDWKKWIDGNLEKALEHNSQVTWDTLNWTFIALTRGFDPFFKKEYVIKTSKTNCTVNGIDACKTMNCPKFGQEHTLPIGRKESDKTCDHWDAQYFYWQYLAPKVGKIRIEVDRMIAALGDASGFERMGHGHCLSAGYISQGVKSSLEHCANSCRAKEQCKFFAFAKNKNCAMYSSEAGDCNAVDSRHRDLVTYMKSPQHSPVSPYQSVRVGYPDTPAFYFSGRWAALKKNQQEGINKGLNTAEYKGWVKAAWMKCFEIDAATTHVSVWINAGFRCYKSTSFSWKESTTVKTWVKSALAAENAPIAMVKEGDGYCHPYTSSIGPWAVGPQTLGEKAFDTDEYMAWVRAAWAKCVAKDANTTYVSVFKDAGYQCVNKATCTIVASGKARAWRPAFRK
eukprot:Skav215475  [mRNA]  locus=scaffold4792:36423:44966:+ [translate_table: standard]